ncbi:MAG: hypothetical protein JWN28_683 [Candidatus Saccharibacteria bacterium]|nr:hypothetical protein [Candidatus Saccharibacteria bacterium]
MAEIPGVCEMKRVMAKAFFKKTTLFATAFVLAISGGITAVPFFLTQEAAAMATPYSQSFEYDNDWTNSTVVNSGADGFAASDGSKYARASSGAFTKWGSEYRKTFPAGGYSTSLDLFLYMNTASNGADLRVDYSSAINNQSGNHLRDFIFHLGTDPTNSNQWLVSASNNSPGNPSVGDNVAITQDGWYTLKQDFKNNNGVLEVTMSIVKKSNGSVFKTWVLSNPSDTISDVVGGNRYGWFTGDRFDISYVAIDNAKLTLYNAPQPTAPQNGGATTSNNGSANFGWNGVDGATSYEVRYSQGPSRTPNNVDGQLDAPLGTLATTENAVSTTGLPGGTLFWQVRGLFDGVQGPWSNIWSTNINFEREVVVSSDNLNGWALTNVAGGVPSLKTVTNPVAGVGALNVVTDGNTASKAGAEMAPTNIPLKDLSDLSYKSRQNAASIASGDAAYRINFDADGNLATTTDRATLVYEPYWQTGYTSQPGSWQTWDVDAGKLWASIPGGNSVAGLENGAGGPPFYSLSQVQSLQPNAKVLTLGTGIGSYNLNYNIDVDQFVVGLNVNGSYLDKTTYNFEPDTTAPVAPTLTARTGAGVALTSGGATTSYEVVADWNDVSDASSYIYKYWNNIAGNPYTQASPYTVNGLTNSESAGVFNQGEGTHYMQVFAVDAAGNVSAGSNIFEITYDVTAPSVTLDQFEDETDTPNISGTAGGANEVLITIDNDPEFAVPVTGGNWSYTASGIEEGTYNVTVVARDTAGNRSATATGTLTVAYADDNNGEGEEDPDNSGTGTDTESGAGTETEAVVVTPLAVSTIVPTIINPTTFAGILGDSTDTTNTDTNDTDGAGVEGVSTEKTLAQAANSEANQGSFMGMGWYWWLLIIAGIAAIAWWIAAARKRNAEN